MATLSAQLQSLERKDAKPIAYYESAIRTRIAEVIGRKKTGVPTSGLLSGGALSVGMPERRTRMGTGRRMKRIADY
jgi:hypothetical protein